MSLFERFAKSIFQSIGRESLKDAYLGNRAPKKSGIYKLYCRGQLMKVGKAEDGIWKRCSDYYRGAAGGTAGLKHINITNRDECEVSWVVVPRGKCREYEKKMYDAAKQNGEEMPWSERR